jgi:hypothetical protein
MGGGLAEAVNVEPAYGTVLGECLNSGDVILIVAIISVLVEAVVAGIFAQVTSTCS